MRRTMLFAVTAICIGAMPAASAATDSSFASQFPARVLADSNAERSAVGEPPLTWDNALGSGAAAYAQQMAFTGMFEHSDRSSRHGIGENLWYGTHGAYSIDAMLGAWASEKRMFAPGIFPNISRTGNWADVGHYTQMIWPSTQRIGCALASTPRYDYLVCRYAPAGNIDGKPVP